MQRALALVQRLCYVAAVKSVHLCGPRCGLAITGKTQLLNLSSYHATPPSALGAGYNNTAKTAQYYGLHVYYIMD